LATSALRRATRRSRFGAIVARVGAEQASRLREAIGLRKRLQGATHRSFSTEQSLDYINSVYADYVSVARIPPGFLTGARVLEIGPGDNLGVAARFVADGAAEVVALDRFSTWRDYEQQGRIYRALSESLDDSRRGRLMGTVGSSGSLDLGRGRIKLVEGVSIEHAGDRLVGGRFNLIVSRAVIEHVQDIPAAFKSMDGLLAEGGWMVHKVDLSDHGMFSEGGQHPLTFLTVGDRTWRMMGAKQGLPNRLTMADYSELLDGMGYENWFRVTAVIGEAQELGSFPEALDGPRFEQARRLAETARPDLLDRYRARPAADLATAGFFLVATRR
jgi:SAM-dependent methyltransferase